MNILKKRSTPGGIPDRPNARRRSFMWKIGAAVPALMASVVPGRSNPGNNQEAGLKSRIDNLSGRLGILEDEKAVRELHREYEDLLSEGRYEEVAKLFADDGEVLFNGGTFKGKSEGVRRLYAERFRSGQAGRRIEPPPGTDRRQDAVDVAADRKSAGARFPFSIQVGAPIVSDSPLVKMARLHGEGIMKWWEGGTYEVSYVKDTRDGCWKIRRLQYHVVSRTDYRPGKLRSKPVSVSLFSKVYPEDPAGPDILADGDKKAHA
jgi:hypothetical protein